MARLRSKIPGCRIVSLVLLMLIGTVQGIEAAKLVEVTVLDKDYLVVHFMDGEVIRRDDGLGSCAFKGHCHSLDGSFAVHYLPALSTTEAGSTASWVLQSSDHANYSGSGLTVSQVHRKSKMNGMTVTGWNPSIWDDIYDHTLEHFIYLRLPHSLVQGKSYTLNIASATNSDQTSVTFTYDIFNSRSEAIHINLAGYSTDPDIIKAADLYHWMGGGGARDYSSFVGNKVYIYNVATGASQEVGSVAFRGGNNNDWSLKSPVWTIDFTGFSTPGTYRLAVEGVGCSQDFVISPTPFLEPFRVSTLGFFYMRVGQDSPEMTPRPREPLLMPDQVEIRITTMHPHHPDWQAIRQDDDNWDELPRWEPYDTGRKNPYAWGGHSDAYDWDRHLGHASIVWDLLLPYIMSQGALAADNLGIAESGNGIPDVLDSARFEVDFYLRLRDGTGYSHGLTCPDDNYQYIYQAGHSAISAWVNALCSAMLAEAFRISGHSDLMAHYRDAAIEAFGVAESYPDPMLNAVHESGESMTRGRDLKMMAAAYLYNVTGDTAWENTMAATTRITSPTSPVQDKDAKFSELWGVAAYLKTPHTVNYPTLFNNMRSAIISEAISFEAGQLSWSPHRRGTDPQTSYWKTAQDMQRTIIAHAVTTDDNQRRTLHSALVLEASWGLGRNPGNIIQMTTATTALAGMRSVTHAYTSGYNDGTPGLHPGHTPYWNMDDWYGGRIMGRPSWMASHGFPAQGDWPSAELYFPTDYVWAHAEFTPQQTMRGKQALYGYLYALESNYTPPPPPVQFTLTVNATNGMVTRTPSKSLYNENESVSLTPVAANGFTFSHWSGDASGSDVPLALIMNDDKVVTAHFVAVPTYALTVTNGSGSGNYSQGFVVSISANAPPSGKQFAGWTGDVAHVADAMSATTTVTMPAAPVAVTATYANLPPPPAELVVYRDASTLITGTWGDGLQELTSGGYEGSKHYRWSYTISGWWVGIGLNLNNWGGGQNYDVSEFEFLSLAIDGPSQGAHEFNIKLLSAGGGEGPIVRVFQTQPYAMVHVPLVDLKGASNLDLTQIREIQFGMGGVQSGSGILYFDAIAFTATTQSPPELTPAEQWRQTWFAQTENSGDAADSADPDKDGVVNKLERAFGGNPTESGTAILPTMKMLDASGAIGGGYPALTWRQLSGGNGAVGANYAAGGLMYTLQVSSNLTSWTEPVNMLQVGSPVDVGSGYESVTVRLTDLMDPSNPVFLRLSIRDE